MAYYNSKTGYYYSTALHICIAVAAFVFAFVGEIFKFEDDQPPVVFQIVEPSPEVPNIQESPKSEIQEISQPDIKPIEPIEIPEPEPVVEPEPAPKPDPKTEPKPEPAPKPVEKPKEQAPVKKVSYEDFVKKNPKKAAPQQKPRLKPQKVDYKRVTASTGNLDKIADAKITTVGGASAAMRSALDIYVQYIHSQAKRNWVIPSSITGMDLAVRIEFGISANGAITGVKILQSSGNADFDNSVMNLFKVLRLEAPPDSQPHRVSLIFKSNVEA